MDSVPTGCFPFKIKTMGEHVVFDVYALVLDSYVHVSIGSYTPWVDTKSKFSVAERAVSN